MLQNGILAFSWNAAGLRICESLSSEKVEKARKGIKSVFRKSCVAPNFFNNIRDLIITKKPILVVMVTEDESGSGSYFHSKFLPNIMPELGYNLINKQSKSASSEFDTDESIKKIPTGDPKGSLLQISIYSTSTQFTVSPKVDTIQCSQGSLLKSRKSVGIAVHLQHPQLGKLTFIAVQLTAGPMGKLATKMLYPEYRTSTRASNNLCLTDLITKFINSLEQKPNGVFILGDFNYDVVISGRDPHDIIDYVSKNYTTTNVQQLHEHDELKREMKQGLLPGFNEGVDNNGPMFLPNFRLNRGRDEKCQSNLSASCYNSSSKIGGIGWHDRILYKNIDSAPYFIKCKDYSRLDILSMQSSTHCGVIGQFELWQKIQ